MAGVVVQFVRVRPDAIPPARMTAAAAGYDLAACLGTDAIALAPGARARVPTGLGVAIPNGYEGQVRPRSGWADRSGVTVLNAPGTIDADYRGEVMVILVNHGRETVNIRHGDRIAQLLIAPVTTPSFVEVDALPEAVPESAIDPKAASGLVARGTGGFGSTDRPRGAAPAGSGERGHEPEG